MGTPPKKHTKPWEQFPEDTATPSTEEELHRAIGAACAAWSTVEHQLFLIFRDAFLPNRVMSAWKMYASFPTSSGKVNYIKAAIEGVFDKSDPRSEALTDLLNNLVLKFAPRRNDIVHGMVFSDQGSCILGTAVGSMKDFSEPGYQYGAEQIMFYAEQFKHLAADVNITRMLIFPRPGAPRLSWPDTPLTQYIRRTREALRKI